MYSETLRKYLNRPRWKVWLQAISIMLVWLFATSCALAGYGDHPFVSSVLMLVVTGALLNIFLTMSDYEPVAKKIDLELGEQIERLDYELEVLTEKYVALQQEHAKLLKQKSTP